jgi:hypothetical protein
VADELEPIPAFRSCRHFITTSSRETGVIALTHTLESVELARIRRTSGPSPTSALTIPTTKTGLRTGCIERFAQVLGRQSRLNMVLRRIGVNTIRSMALSRRLELDCGCFGGVCLRSVTSRLMFRIRSIPSASIRSWYWAETTISRSSFVNCISSITAVRLEVEQNQLVGGVV